MSSIKSFQDLEVWKRSRKLATNIYTLTRLFPKEEQFGLTSQMRRAAISITSNIAEGHGRPGRKDFVQFLAIALGSSAELLAQMIVACDLGYVEEKTYNILANDIDQLQKMLYRLRQSLQKSE